MSKSKVPISQLTKEEFNEAYEDALSRNQHRPLSRDLVLWIALTHGQITQEKYNELI